MRVEKAATPPVRLEVPRTLVPSRNWTPPVGVEMMPATLAVRVSVWA